MEKQIKVFATDIDGVLTDGKIYIDAKNRSEHKSINLKDIDSLCMLQKEGIILVAITGERDCFTEYVKNRIPWNAFFEGCKNKLERLNEWALQKGYSLCEICYIGDGIYDLPVLKEVGISVCPFDAIQSVKDCVDVIVPRNGGGACISEVADLIINYNKKGEEGKI